MGAELLLEEEHFIVPDDEEEEEHLVVPEGEHFFLESTEFRDSLSFQTCFGITQLSFHSFI